MFGQVKKILGIEGVKVDIISPEKVTKKSGTIEGFIKLTSLTDNNAIEEIKINLIEKYSRGRGKDKLINEYTIGDLILNEHITISKNDIIEILFELYFTLPQSEMDKLGSSNFFTSALVGLAKKARNVHSEFTIKAEVKVKGTKLNAVSTKPILLT